MPIPIQAGPKDIETIRITAKFETDPLETSIPLPAIIVSAITCERQIDPL